MTVRELYTGTITGVLGNIVYAIIVGLMEESDGFINSIINVITAKIPLWYFLAVIIIAFFIVLIMMQRRKKQLFFLDHTEEEYNGVKFQWVWKLNETTNHFEMVDFWPICPKCGNQLRVELYEKINAYHCSNGHFYDFDILYNSRCDLIHKLQRDYKEYANIIDFPD